jgi:hypothetical protein
MFTEAVPARTCRRALAAGCLVLALVAGACAPKAPPPVPTGLAHPEYV